MPKHGCCHAQLLLLLVLLLACCSISVDAIFGFGDGGGRQRRQRPQKPKYPDVDYYALLELDELREEATERDIKQNYRRLSRKLHPDVAKTAAERELYSEVNRAYEVLSDKRKRKMYDLRGAEGLALLEQSEMAGAHQQHNPLAQVFGLSPDNGLKGPPAKTTLVIDLATVFMGGTEVLEFGKQKICPHCKGGGAEKHSPMDTCHVCQGNGVVLQRMEFGPGMVQTVQQTCPHCHGEGVTPRHSCHVCRGKKVVRGHTTLHVEIDRGVPEGHEVVFEMEAEESPDRIPGDLHVVIQTRPHPRFSRRRNGVDLEALIQVGMIEALTGFNRELVHLDRREKVAVQQSAGTITPFGTVLLVRGKGMPRHNTPSERGDLYVSVEFELPRKLTPAQREAVEKFL